MPSAEIAVPAPSPEYSIPQSVGEVAACAVKGITLEVLRTLGISAKAFGYSSDEELGRFLAQVYAPDCAVDGWRAEEKKFELPYDTLQQSICAFIQKAYTTRQYAYAVFATGGNTGQVTRVAVEPQGHEVILNGTGHEVVDAFMADKKREIFELSMLDGQDFSVNVPLICSMAEDYLRNKRRLKM